jgi:uncharacterized protein YpiB (UPF0302 family)
MEKNLLNAPQQGLDVMDSLVAEMFLDNVIADFQKKQIQKEIDQSLAEGNKTAFLELSEKLKSFS